MSDNPYDNSGALFKAKPSENPRWAQYEGKATVNGVDYWIKAWIKDGQSGKFFSLAFKPKEQRAAEPSIPVRAADGVDDDDIPF